MNGRLIGALVIVAAVLLAGCAGVTGGQVDATNEPIEPERTVEVTASGEATAEPDRATLIVAVEARGESPDAVRESLASDDDALRAALTEWGLEKDQIRTDRYDIRETRESTQERDVEEYVGQHRYEIELHDVDAVSEVIDVSVDAGADRIQRIRFGLSEDREDEIREAALENAVENADTNARVLADNTDLEIVGVYTISTAEQRVSPYTASPRSDVAEDVAQEAATGIETGDVSVDVRVHVVFEAESST